MFYLVIYWTQKVHNDFISLCCIVLPPFGHSSIHQYHCWNLQDNRIVVRIFIELLRFSFDSPSYIRKFAYVIKLQPSFWRFPRNSQSFVNKCPTKCNYTQFIISVNCSTYFGWFLHQSSGAQITVSAASGTSQPLLQPLVIVEEFRITSLVKLTTIHH